MTDKSIENNIDILIAHAHKSVSQPDLTRSALVTLSKACEELKGMILSGAEKSQKPDAVQFLDHIITKAETRIAELTFIEKKSRQLPSADFFFDDPLKLGSTIPGKKEYLHDYFVEGKRQQGRFVLGELSKIYSRWTREHLIHLFQVLADLKYIPKFEYLRTVHETRDEFYGIVKKSLNISGGRQNYDPFYSEFINQRNFDEQMLDSLKVEIQKIYESEEFLKFPNFQKD